MTAPITQENKKECLCGMYNTYKYNDLEGRLFCATGKADTTPQRKGCECFTFPVSAEYKLCDYYFCVNSAGK